MRDFERAKIEYRAQIAILRRMRDSVGHGYEKNNNIRTPGQELAFPIKDSDFKLNPDTGDYEKVETEYEISASIVTDDEFQEWILEFAPDPGRIAFDEKTKEFVLTCAEHGELVRYPEGKMELETPDAAWQAHYKAWVHGV